MPAAGAGRWDSCRRSWRRIGSGDRPAERQAGAARRAQPTHRELPRRNEALREENRRRREALAAKDRRIAELEAVVVRQAAAMGRPEARVAQLERLLEKATRAGKRQVAPFSKGSPEEDPKKPGRKSGDAYGAKAHRPLPERRPDEVIDGPLPRNCPDCGGVGGLPPVRRERVPRLTDIAVIHGGIGRAVVGRDGGRLHRRDHTPELTGIEAAGDAAGPGAPQ